MPSRKKTAQTKRKNIIFTPLHLICTAILIILLAGLNLIIYFSPPKTIVVHAKDTTPFLQVEYLKGILKDHPTYREGWVLLAKVEYALGNKAETQNAITKVKELDPNYKELDSLQSLLTSK